MGKEDIKVPADISRQWEEVRLACRLLVEGKGRIVIRTVNGKEQRYVKRY